MDTRMVGSFDLERYLRNSKKVDISDINIAQAAQYTDEIHCLTYMMDIESHTIVYLRSILSTCAIEDPDTTAFLSCWAYEEHFHGRAIGQFLKACGIEFARDRVAEVQRSTAFSEWLKDVGASLVCQCTRHFHAACLTYGAISELSNLRQDRVLRSAGKNAVAFESRKMPSLVLHEPSQIHYNKAKIELRERNAQRLATFVIKTFWLPVGGGVKSDAEVSWILNYILQGPAGEKVARRIDETIAKLPGLGWFDRLSESRAQKVQHATMDAAPAAAVGLRSAEGQS